MDKSVLRQLGLTNNEVSLYLTLLRMGSSTATKIAEKAGMNRAYVYDTLEGLIEKGLVSYVLREGKKHFNASHPKKLSQHLQEKQKSLDTIMPDLLKMVRAEKEECSVEVFKGRGALKTVLKNNLEILKKTKGEHLAMGVDDKKYLEAEPIYFRQFIKLLEKHNIRERMISRKGERVFAGGKTSEYKFIPEEFFNPTATHIAGNTVSVVVWSLPIYAIVIKSGQVADSYRKYFDLLWDIAKKGKWRKYLS